MGKICLVLEGGGNRGVYTSGVLDAFLENNIDIRDIYGVSAGALNALSYLSKQKGRSLKINKEYIYNEQCVNYKRLFLGKNVVDLNYILEEINMKDDPLNMEEFNKSKNFVVVATNVLTGSPVYKKIEDYKADCDYIKASASLPIFTKTVHIGNLKLLDGGLSDSIPVVKALDDGYDKVIAVLTRDINFMCQPYKHMNVYKTKYLKYPNFISAMENRHNKYNVTRDLITKFSQEGKVLAIYPSEKIEIKHLENDLSKIEYVYQLGYNDALNMIKEIKEFIKGA